MMIKIKWSYVSLAQTWVTGPPPPGARPGGGARGRAPGAQTYTHGAGIAGHSPKQRRVTPFTQTHHQREGPKGSGCKCELGSGRRWGPWQSDPRLQKLALRTWNVTSLVGKEPELVHEVEKFRQDIVGLTSTHSKGFSRGVGLSSTLELPLGRGAGAGVAILIAPRLGACMLELTPVDERVASLRLWVGGTDPDCCLCLWSKQQLRVSTLFGLLGGGAGKCSLWGFARSAGGTSTLT